MSISAYEPKPIRVIPRQEYTATHTVAAWKVDMKGDAAPAWVQEFMGKGQITFAEEGFTNIRCLTVRHGNAETSAHDGQYIVCAGLNDIAVVPAEAFEAKYAPVPAGYKERVHAELDNLKRNIYKLEVFVNPPPIRAMFFGLPEAERYRLYAQLQCMRQYADILQQRIDNF